MEKGNTRTEPSVPYVSMYQDIQDMRVGIKTFDELRKAWAAWAREAIQDLQSQGKALGLLDDLDSADSDKSE